MKLNIKCLALLGLLWAGIGLAQPEDIIFWHSMAGALGDELNYLVKSYNQQQSRYRIHAIYKGSYHDTMISFIAAFRAHQAPHIIQISDIGTALMLATPNVIEPFYKLADTYHLTMPAHSLLANVAPFYSREHRLQALPFNVSIPLMYFNKKALAKVGVNETNFPKDWASFGQVLNALKRQGYVCGFTTAYPGWIHIEAFGVLHHLSHSKIYSSALLLKHLERLKSWQKAHYFEYGGQADEAVMLFTNGRCAMLSDSSGSYQNLKTSTNFVVGVAPLPVDETLKVRAPNLSGGGALWVRAHLTPAIYQGVADFYRYWLTPQVQQYWHLHTGYLSFFAHTTAENKTLLNVVTHDLSGFVDQTTNNMSLIPQHQLRLMHDELLEALFASNISVAAILQDTQQRAYHLLQRFWLNHPHT